MLKRLGRKVLPIIMASMLVTSMAAVSVSAVEVSVDNAVVSGDSATSYYVDEYSGVKLESDSLTINPDDVFVSYLDSETFPMIAGIMEKSFDISIFNEEYTEEDGLYVNLTKTPVTAYLPCANEGRYVVFMSNDYMNAEAQEPVQVEAEYVDGYYKVQLVEHGTYIICDYPLAEGDGEMLQQTLVDETTGISVAGMVQSDSKLLVVDIVQLVKDIYFAFEDMGSLDGVEVETDDESVQELYNILESIKGYVVCPVRNFDIAKTEGELTVSIPSELEGYEVRNMDILSEDFTSGSTLLDYEDILSDTAFETKTNQQIADDVNAMIDTLLTKLTAEYIEGNYVVNSETLGLFVVAQEGTLMVTADDIQVLREEYEAEKEEPTDAPTGGVIDTNTQTPTQAPAPTPAPAPTQAPTTSTTSGKVVNTGNSQNIPAMLMILGAATATIATLRKKGLVK